MSTVIKCVCDCCKQPVVVVIICSCATYAGLLRISDSYICWSVDITVYVKHFATYNKSAADDSKSILAKVWKLSITERKSIE